MIDDPASAPIQRWPTPPPPSMPEPALPPGISPRTVTLRDGATAATIMPFTSQDDVPASLLRFLCDLFNAEIEAGDTYPVVEPLPFDKFAAYWFQNFAAVMLLSDAETTAAGTSAVVADADAGAADALLPPLWREDTDWASVCLGSYYVKPNYPGRSSHVCNAGFLVAPSARGRGVGRLLGESYVDWAPRLGYEYSVFNLVYETNVASCRIWDALGFERIGRVKGCGRLKSYPGRKVDAIVYGRELGGEADGGGTGDTKDVNGANSVNGTNKA
ncbi:Protein spt10 [Purpureocillium takamizusanense]|uniref:Protein spt10 n=1 Tax=Purpureocillium takamizusanense TaxID=2060973 RepID=A0A9Q8Q7T8_9HYPO|nr:Protein spt10 [Purpureocillium takamizusanense]UNI15429.1 Protein spt10 [Purpureocillium takamizusanense]